MQEVVGRLKELLLQYCLNTHWRVLRGLGATAMPKRTFPSRNLSARALTQPGQERSALSTHTMRHSYRHGWMRSAPALRFSRNGCAIQTSEHQNHDESLR